MDKGNLIRALILEESSNEAEALASALRNAGHAVRYRHFEDDEDLQEALEEQSWDILLAARQVGDYSVTQAISAIAQQGKDIPAIVFGPRESDDDVVSMLKAGAKDYINEDARDHLLLVLVRELDNLLERRAHRRCKNLYQESEKRNRVLLDSSRDPVAYIHDGMHVHTNQSYLEMFGYNDGEELESIPVMDLIVGDDQQKFKEILRTLSRGETPEGTYEFQVVRNSGEEFSATMQFSPASYDGEPCTQVIIHQKTRDKELEKELQQLRQQDLLTGLYNQQYFLELLKDSVAKATQGHGNSALIYLEPNDFKSVKNAIGIAGSDTVLANIARVLREKAPEQSILARYAGTVFAMVLEDSTAVEAGKFADALRLELANKIFDVEGKSITTTCSIGIAPINETAGDAKAILSHAERACNIANKGGGNLTHIFSEEDALASMEADKKMVTMIQMALKNNRFQLQYQPIVSLHAEPGERYEVLLRMLDADGNQIMPAEFIDAAEQSNLMPEIDRWVIKHAAKALLNKRKMGKEIKFFIKLSTNSLLDPGMLGWLGKLLQAARLHGDSLVFEIPEQAAMENLKAVKVFANGLKVLQCNFAVDHVGSRTSTLSYLDHFKVNFIKIDGTHIANINNQDSQEIIKTITDLGRRQGFHTIAEHVQDPTCLAVLWQHGVNFIQGYYLQQPEDRMDYDFSGGGAG